MTNAKLKSRTALVAALIALAIGAAAPPTSVAATSAGQLYAFGRNAGGQLGNAANVGTNEPNPTPTLVTLPGVTGPVTKAAAGQNHSLVLSSTGQLYAFGDNYFGQLGNATNNGTYNPNPTPTLVTLLGATGPVTQVAAGENHSLALTSSGQLYAFGQNDHGQLGNATNNGTYNPNPTPTLVTLPGATGPVVQIAAGGDHSLALTSTDQLYAFGGNYAGQLGNTTNNETSKANPTPALVTLPGESGPVTQIVAGGGHSLVLTASGQLYAFGSNVCGQLGGTTNIGTQSANPTPTLVTLPGATGSVTHVAAGGAFTLALTSTGQLYSFGLNYSGQLGSTANNGTSEPNPTPTLVTLPGATDPVVQIGAGAWDSLALTSGGRLYSFGSNYYGQLGRTTTTSGPDNPNPIPTAVDVAGGTTVDMIAPGPDAGHTLVVTADLAVTSNALPSGTVGASYSAGVTAEGGRAPYAWQASGLPTGLSIDMASGQISGIPQAEGTAQVSLSVTDRFGIVAKGAPITLRIESAPPARKRPALIMLRQSHRRWREGRALAQVSSLAAQPNVGRVPVGTTFTFRLNERARVRFVFARRKEERKGKPFRKAGALTIAGQPGKNQVKFQGRTSGRKSLRSGRYKLTATARSGGLRSKPQSLSFTIMR
jgi:alpha-tubulin suppressor-like RCC1 family protein